MSKRSEAEARVRLRYENGEFNGLGRLDEGFFEREVITEMNGPKIPLDKPKTRRTILPVVAVAAVMLFVVAILVGLGFAIGRSIDSSQQPTKQAGEVFDRADYRLAGEPFVKMPEELP